VAFVRRRCGVKRVGHAGTLDPAASGVLPVCLGRATRVIEYLMDARKVYRATILLGRETDTYDTTGATMATANAANVRVQQVESAVDQFRGEIEQIPPAFSALKQQGTPLYKLARAGQIVTPAPRRVTVYRAEIMSFDLPRLQLEIECSKGTYIRSLAHDLGLALAVGGCLEDLERLRVGPFAIADAITPQVFERELKQGILGERILSPDEVLLDWPAAVVGAENGFRIVTGRSPLWSEDQARRGVISGVQRCRAYDAEGEFLAVLRLEASHEWRPEKVFRSGPLPETAERDR